MAPCQNFCTNNGRNQYLTGLYMSCEKINCFNRKRIVEKKNQCAAIKNQRWGRARLPHLALPLLTRLGQLSKHGVTTSFSKSATGTLKNIRQRG